MLLVTHDLPEVRQFADWVVLYQDGRVLQAGAVPEVVATPGNEEAAALLEAAAGA